MEEVLEKPKRPRLGQKIETSNEVQSQEPIKKEKKPYVPLWGKERQVEVKQEEIKPEIKEETKPVFNSDYKKDFYPKKEYSSYPKKEYNSDFKKDYNKPSGERKANPLQEKVDELKNELKEKKKIAHERGIEVARLNQEIKIMKGTAKGSVNALLKSRNTHLEKQCKNIIALYHYLKNRSEEDHKKRLAKYMALPMDNEAYKKLQEELKNECRSYMYYNKLTFVEFCKHLEMTPNFVSAVVRGEFFGQVFTLMQILWKLNKKVDLTVLRKQ